MLNCSSRNCSLSNCWDESTAALLVRVLALIPLPIEEGRSRTEITLYQEKQDFGITAAMVAIIFISVTAATVAGLAMSQTSVVAETVDKLVGQVSEELQTQNGLNVQIKLGMLNLNQQVAVLQEQIDAPFG